MRLLRWRPRRDLSELRTFIVQTFQFARTGALEVYLSFFGNVGPNGSRSERGFSGGAPKIGPDHKERNRWRQSPGRANADGSKGAWSRLARRKVCRRTEHTLRHVVVPRPRSRARNCGTISSHIEWLECRAAPSTVELVKRRGCAIRACAKLLKPSDPKHDEPQMAIANLSISTNIGG